MGRLCAMALVLALTESAAPQSLERAIAESKKLREAPAPAGANFIDDLKTARDRSREFHTALRDWAESLLPKTRADLDSQLPHYTLGINAELRRAGLDSGPKNAQYAPGVVDRVDVIRPAGDPDKIVLVVGVDVPCGIDDAVYLYDYSAGSRRRVLESHGERLESFSSIEFSDRDVMGNQSVAVFRYGVQCGSSWNALGYEWYRLSSTADSAVPILTGDHGVWFGAEEPYQVRLKPDELLIELRDRSIDAGVHNRAHVLHYRASNSAAERTDPVALQPQDFADEWLNRPWAEMESQSAAGEKMKRWHEFLAGDFVAGDYLFVQPCTDKPGDTQVGLALDWVHGNELPEPMNVFFVVHQVEQYRFEMRDISFRRQKGCPGQSYPQTEGPTLFPKK